MTGKALTIGLAKWFKLTQSLHLVPLYPCNQHHNPTKDCDRATDVHGHFNKLRDRFNIPLVLNVYIGFILGCVWSETTPNY